MTDDEIRSYMDFDRLLEMHKKTPIPRGFPNSRQLWVLAIIGGIGIFSWVMFFNTSGTGEKSSTDKIANTTQQAQSNARDLPSDSATTATREVLKKEDSFQSKKMEKVQRQESQSHPDAVELTTADRPDAVPSEKNESAQQTPNLVYVQAVPVNGYPDLYEYFNRELKYPQEALKDSVQGEVTAVFTINVNGLPEKIIIENSLGPRFDQEVVRLITNMPAWRPATYNNKPVASKMSLPLTFQITKIPSQK